MFALYEKKSGEKEKMANGNSLVIQSPLSCQEPVTEVCLVLPGLTSTRHLCSNYFHMQFKKNASSRVSLKKNPPHLNPQHSQSWAEKAPAQLAEPSQTASFRSIPCSKSHIWTCDIPACSQPSLHPEQTDPPSP